MPKFAAMCRRSGLSLIEIVVALAVGGLALWGAMRAFKLAQVATTQTATQQNKDAEVELLTANLRSLFQAFHSFQSLSFSPAPNLKSTGAGFLVVPNQGMNGAPSPGNDRIYFVTTVPMPVEVRLAADFGPGFPPGNSLQMSSADGKTPVASIFKAGETVVLSSGLSSEVIRLGSAPSPAGAATASVPIDKNSYQNSFVKDPAAPALRANFSKNDFVLKARLLTLALDSAANTLVVTGGTPSPRILATKVTKFSALYQLKAGASCAGENFGPDFARDKWDVLNTGDSNRCYKKVDKLKFVFTQDGKENSYVVGTNQ